MPTAPFVMVPAWWVPLTPRPPSLPISAGSGVLVHVHRPTEGRPDQICGSQGLSERADQEQRGYGLLGGGSQVGELEACPAFLSGVLCIGFKYTTATFAYHFSSPMHVDSKMDMHGTCL